MKSILKWLEEAKQQGYDWAEAAIRNYNCNYAIIKDVETLSSALNKAFSWRKSPEGFHYWNRVFKIITTPLPITQVSPIQLETLIEDLGKLNSAIGNLEYNETLKEPYRTQVYEATKASYKEQLVEVKAKIAEKLSIEPQKERKLIGWVAADADGNIFYFKKPTKFGVQWQGIHLISKDDALYLCDRVPEWRDNEPIEIYE